MKRISKPNHEHKKLFLLPGTLLLCVFLLWFIFMWSDIPLSEMNITFADTYSMSAYTNKLLDSRLVDGCSPVWNGKKLQQHTQGMSNNGTRNPLEHFTPMLSETERCMLNRMVEVFVNVTESFNFTYFLFFGSLLGTYRHEGQIPWDLDVDVMMDVEQETEITEAFQAYLPPGYRFIRKKKWKLVFNHTLISRTFGAPVVDIFFYRKNGSNITGAGYGFGRIPFSHVFPLTRRPFWNMWLPVPRVYGRPMAGKRRRCVCTDYEKRFSGEKNPIIDCSLLDEFYPFTFQKTLDNETVQEELIMNGKVIQQVIVG